MAMHQCYHLYSQPATPSRRTNTHVLNVLSGNLFCCRITNAGLPGGLARLPYLKSIGLKRNCLTSVPRMLGQMQSLQEIYLEDNNDLEASFAYLLS